jgi:hypothetical protein
MSTTQLWQSIVDRWRTDKIERRRGVASETLANFETNYGVLLPPAVREYFTFVDGTGEDMGGHLYRFWPLDQVKPVHEVLADTDFCSYPDRFSYPDCFVFADHCISCWDYALRLTNDPAQPAPVFRVTASDPPGEMMAASFLEFMRSYASDPGSII